MSNKEYFEHLNARRASGEINMMGAARELQEDFGLGKVDARKIVTAWMEQCSNFITGSPRFNPGSEK